MIRNSIRYIPAMLSTEKHRGLLAGLFLLAVTILVYIPALRAGFVWDDDDFLWDNPLVHRADGLYKFWFSTLWRDYFPITSTTIWLEWRLFGAENPWGYHLTNILLHATSSLLLWRVLKRLEIPGAWLAALVFAVHPVNVESVAWITQRKNTLPMMFSLLSVLLFLKSEAPRRGGAPGPPPTWRSPHYWWALFCFLLALLSKTSVVMLPVALLAIRWWQTSTLTIRDCLRSIPFFALSGALSLVTIWFQHHRAIMGAVVRDDGLVSRVVIAAWAIWFYLYKALLPLTLMFVYPRWEADTGNPVVYLPLLALLALAIALWFLRSRPWARAGLAALVIYSAMLFPVLGFFNIYFMRYSLVADHYQYFSIPAAIALVAALGTITARRFAKPAASTAVAAVVVALLSIHTWRLASDYEDAETLWHATTEKNPACWVGLYNLGSYYAQNGRMEEAIILYREALRYEPDHFGILENLALALNEMGGRDEAIELLRRVVEIRSEAAPPYVNLGSVLFAAGQLDEAIVNLTRALEIDPREVSAHNNLGVALIAKGRFDDAIFYLTRLLTIEPDHADGHYNLGNAYLYKGQPGESIGYYRKSLELKPDHFLVHNSLGAALTATGQWREAASHFERSLAMRPGDLAAINNLAWVLATSPDPSARDGARAVELAESGNQATRGENPAALHTLAAAYAEAGQLPEAVKTAVRALELATAQGNADLTARIQKELEHYKDGSPYRSGAPSADK